MDDRLVTLTVHYSLIEARICVSMLEAHGIFALAPTELANNAPHLMTALGGIPVMVIGRDYEAARALLADVETRAESEPPPPARPILRRLWDAMVGALVLLVVAGLPPRRPRPGPGASRMAGRVEGSQPPAPAIDNVRRHFIFQEQCLRRPHPRRHYPALRDSCPCAGRRGVDPARRARQYRQEQ
jgi:hypothetical protein